MIQVVNKSETNITCKEHASAYIIFLVSESIKVKENSHYTNVYIIKN